MQAQEKNKSKTNTTNAKLFIYTQKKKWYWNIWKIFNLIHTKKNYTKIYIHIIYPDCQNANRLTTLFAGLWEKCYFQTLLAGVWNSSTSNEGRFDSIFQNCNYIYSLTQEIHFGEYVLQINTENDLCTSFFIAFLFIIAKYWTYVKGPSIWKSLSKLYYTIVEYV